MRRRSLLGIVLGFALVAGACSGNQEEAQVASLEPDTTAMSESIDSPVPDPMAGSESAGLAFAQCLRERGVDVDDPTVDADGNLQLPPIEFTSDAAESDPEAAMAEVEESLAVCEEHLEGVVMTGDSSSPAEFEDTLLEYAQCMRAHGYDMPDPDLSSGGGVIDLGNADDMDFEAADAECRHILSDLGIGG